MSGEQGMQGLSQQQQQLLLNLTSVSQNNTEREASRNENNPVAQAYGGRFLNRSVQYGQSGNQGRKAFVFQDLYGGITAADSDGQMPFNSGSSLRVRPPPA